MNFYKNSINSFESNNSYDELLRMPKWAKDEQIYNCDNSKETKEKRMFLDLNKLKHYY